MQLLKRIIYFFVFHLTDIQVEDFGAHIIRYLFIWSIMSSFLKKWAIPGLFLFIFVLFTQFEQYKLKKA